MEMLVSGSFVLVPGCLGFCTPQGEFCSALSQCCQECLWNRTRLAKAASFVLAASQALSRSPAWRAVDMEPGKMRLYNVLIVLTSQQFIFGLTP